MLGIYVSASPRPASQARLKSFTTQPDRIRYAKSVRSLRQQSANQYATACYYKRPFLRSSRKKGRTIENSCAFVRFISPCQSNGHQSGDGIPLMVDPPAHSISQTQPPNRKPKKTINETAKMTRPTCSLFSLIPRAKPRRNPSNICAPRLNLGHGLVWALVCERYKPRPSTGAVFSCILWFSNKQRWKQ